MESHICPICNESRDPARVRFAHVRLGLDEPPEPILYKCRDPATVMSSVAAKFMPAVRSNDHVVVDAPDVSVYNGVLLAKADGMKVYVFCYEFGYIVTITDPSLSVVACMATIAHSDLPPITSRPDVVLAEMMNDGSLVYVETLAMDADARIPKCMGLSKCPSTTRKTFFIYRTAWNALPTTTQLVLEPMPNDGVVLTNKLRTTITMEEFKRPTIDLIHKGGTLYAIAGPTMFEVMSRCAEMDEYAVYELDVVEGDGGAVRIINPKAMQGAYR
ncbi:hypothetical protein K470DRAFT_220433 [Piedraia hortae CBS 480.64]|uniref:Uncharacterized protein n=1 Tax=Piedraia hortae CBS 480.64 TaxID=1314780 RepID=A0A6A7BU78_9PEZI|nr:hypothetical protein K470DRAFT_220433 [Piedraia hortae CBS 480.64]